MHTTSEQGFSFFMRDVTVLAMLFMLHTLGVAQSTATLQGTVTNPSNAAVANATVLIRSESTGVERRTQTDSVGAYLVPGLLADLYRIEISAPGFQTFVIKDPKLDVATTLSQNAQLRVSTASQQVEVQAGAPLVDTSTVSLGQVIEGKMVQEGAANTFGAC
jgi:hypothetical protein